MHHGDVYYLKGESYRVRGKERTELPPPIASNEDDTIHVMRERQPHADPSKQPMYCERIIYLNDAYRSRIEEA